MVVIATAMITCYAKPDDLESARQMFDGTTGRDCVLPQLVLVCLCRFTFRRVIRKGSTEEFSCIPYIIALLNCLLYTWFSMPVVSKGSENFTVATINGLGILLESSFIIIYIWFASPKLNGLGILLESSFIIIYIWYLFRAFCCMITLIEKVIVLFGMTVFVSSFLLHDHPHRKVFVGSIGLVASIAMYGSPLVTMVRALPLHHVIHFSLILLIITRSLAQNLAYVPYIITALVAHRPL
ncbi:bidirectional sugar transporter SWEET3b-like [Asparagus officinalis]|uniref:bidirectional sugar transporter SWEET3b-like n=1 Tax=Asparagus officinalis TaxID=4686 RepID=UPI00098E0CA0|nr:bidirectional sugar transporter SWEET3b-like [Asparagus officinalis]